MGNRSTAAGSRRMILLNNLSVTTALAPQGAASQAGLLGLQYLIVQANFTYGSGGTTLDIYVQTSLDNGSTYIDIMNFHYTTAGGIKVSACTMNIALAAAVTPTDGTLTSNTIVNGLLGDRVRVKYTSTGTYAGGSAITVIATGVGG